MHTLCLAACNVTQGQHVLLYWWKAGAVRQPVGVRQYCTTCGCMVACSRLWNFMLPYANF